MTVHSEVQRVQAKGLAWRQTASPNLDPPDWVQRVMDCRQLFFDLCLSDDEFIQACTPGTSRDTALRVRRIIAQQLGIPYEHIHPDQDFVDDLDCC